MHSAFAKAERRVYVIPFFKGMVVMKVTAAYLDTVNAAISKRKKNRYQQASVCRSFVRFLRKTNRDLDPESVVLETYSHLIPNEKNEIANFLDDTYDDNSE